MVLASIVVPLDDWGVGGLLALADVEALAAEGLDVVASILLGFGWDDLPEFVGGAVGGVDVDLHALAGGVGGHFHGDVVAHAGDDLVLA